MNKKENKQFVINILDGLSSLTREIFYNQNELSKISKKDLQLVNNEIDKLSNKIDYLASCYRN